MVALAQKLKESSDHAMERLYAFLRNNIPNSSGTAMINPVIVSEMPRILRREVATNVGEYSGTWNTQGLNRKTEKNGTWGPLDQVETNAGEMQNQRHDNQGRPLSFSLPSSQTRAVQTLKREALARMKMPVTLEQLLQACPPLA
jgi:hypothetical protein